MINNPQFTIKEPVSVSGQIYQYLKESIVTCEIEPGSSVSEKAISASLEVSRQPVREAFIKLAECGLLKIYPQRGSVVTRISIKAVMDGKFIRSAIECAVVKNLAQTVTEAQLKVLNEIIGLQQAAIHEQNYREFLRQDDAFHQQMALFADCKLAWDTIDNLKTSMDRVRYLDIKRDKSMDEVVNEHQALIEALRQHNDERAAALLAAHLDDVPEVIDDILMTKADWFETQN
ncbi:GntR family transcriptional regulator [Celerinatantimonas sp. YJH-8]|uniref:GntR family transcriptional regulator n=1 Tax=Celerinatantimonas sp. YJH-8 TaxID=3228714 RepID=UPI0038C5ABAA